MELFKEPLKNEVQKRAEYSKSYGNIDGSKKSREPNVTMSQQKAGGKVARAAMPEKLEAVLHSLSAFAVYGYKKSDSGRNRLVIDEYAAENVRRIFAWKIEGRLQRK